MIDLLTTMPILAQIPEIRAAAGGEGLLLTGAIFLPLLIALFLLLPVRFDGGLVKALAFVGFLFPALAGVILWLSFPGNFAGYAYFLDIDTGLRDFGISLKLGMNGVSIPLFAMAGVVGLAAGLQALRAEVAQPRTFLLLLLFMQAGLMGIFASVDLFWFYFFHEFALIPTFILIAMFGGRDRRGIAIEMAVYLTLGAMLSLAGLIALYVQSGADSFSMITMREYLASGGLAETIQTNIFGFLLIGFGILVSLFPFHTWAPRTYAAAPTAATMLHAGVLKKFGLYGLLQIAAPLLPVGAANWAVPLAILALGNVLIIGFVTMAQRDLKLMLGNSSVMHMGYVFLGIACLSTIGTGGAVLLMVAHGLSVALQFFLAQAIYARTRTFEMESMGGLAAKTPALAVLFVAGAFASAGLPGFANFWGELTVFVAVWDWNPWVAVLAVAGIVISAIYLLRATAAIFFGPTGTAVTTAEKEAPISDLTAIERAPALLLLGALLLVGFWPRTVSETVDAAIDPEITQTAIMADQVNELPEETS